MTTLADKIINFNSNLNFSGSLPEGIRIMNPFKEENVKAISEAFYRKYYNDNSPRHLILGINPGRFGSGLTGIPFTDPKHLIANCGIKYHGPMAHEPSSVFVYDVINAFGGLEAFYSRFYISAVCPLGFTNLSTNLSTNHSTNLSANLSSYGVHESVFSSPQQPLSTNLSSYEVHESVLSIQPPKRREVNYNYYDSRELTSAMMDFIVESLQTQLTFGINRDICFCFGTGKNEKFLNELNNRYGFFKRIIALEHPRYIMQYKAKSKEAYIAKYLEAFGH